MRPALCLLSDWHEDMSLGFPHHGHGHHYQSFLHSNNPLPHHHTPQQPAHHNQQTQQEQQQTQQQQQQQAAENRRRSYENRYAVPCEHPANQWYADERPFEVLRKRQRPNTKILRELLADLTSDTRLTRLILIRYMDFYDPPPPPPPEPEPVVDDPDPDSETDTDTEISSEDERELLEEQQKLLQKEQRRRQQLQQLQQQQQQQQLQSPQAGPSSAAGQAYDPGEGSSKSQGQLQGQPQMASATVDTIVREYPDEFKYTERDLRLLAHDLIKQETAAVDSKKTFPLFSRLPHELQDRIWSEALPTCRYINYSSPLSSDHKNWPMPVPQLARVCRTARDAVMRRGQHVVFHKETRYDWLEGYNDPFSLRLGRDEKAGFLMKSDSLYLSRYPHLVTRNVAQVVGEWPIIGKIKTWRWTVETAQDAIRNASSLYVHWENMNLGFAEPVEPESEHRMSRAMQWELLKECTNLQTLYVDFRESVEVKAALRMPREGQDEELHSRDGGGAVARIEQLVDLFDDERLSELRSLQTVPTRNSERDNFLLARGSFRPTRCVKCEREQWHLYDKTLAERIWLSLHSEELSPEEMPLVFPEDRTYNKTHPWVIEKMEKMPKIVPVLRVKISFYPIDELHYQNERFTKFGRRRVGQHR